MLFKTIRQLKKEATSIHLNNDEKKLMQSNLSAFIKANPVRMETESRQILHLTEQFSVFSFLNRKYMFATIAAVLVVMLTGGVSYAAEGSVPGQPLYPVKQFNEEVKAALSVTAQADAQWEARRVERRLEEAATLAAQGKLNTEAETKIAIHLKEHVQQTEQQLKKLEAEGKIEEAAELGARLNNALSLHGKILTSLQAENSVTTPNNKPYDKDKKDEDAMGNGKNSNGKNTLVTEIKLQASSVSKVKVNLEDKIKGEVQTNAEAAAKGKIGAAKHKIEEVKKFIALKSESVSAETKAKAEAELKLAESEVVKAEADLNAKVYKESFEHATKAHEKAQAAKLIVNTQTNVKLKLNVGKLLEQEEAREIKGNVFSSTTIKMDEKKDEDEDENDERKQENKQKEIKVDSVLKNSLQLKNTLQPKIEIEDEQKTGLKFLP